MVYAVDGNTGSDLVVFTQQLVHSERLGRFGECELHNAAYKLANACRPIYFYFLMSSQRFNYDVLVALYM